MSAFARGHAARQHRRPCAQSAAPARGNARQRCPGRDAIGEGRHYYLCRVLRSQNIRPSHSLPPPQQPEVPGPKITCAILKLKVPIVSTTEELAYPTKANIRYARAIHHMAKKAKVAVRGTGVNLGFVMDALPITVSSCRGTNHSVLKPVIRHRRLAVRRSGPTIRVRAALRRFPIRPDRPLLCVQLQQRPVFGVASRPEMATRRSRPHGGAPKAGEAGQTSATQELAELSCSTNLGSPSPSRSDAAACARKVKKW
jgi:hypothetical protein